MFLVKRLSSLILLSFAISFLGCSDDETTTQNRVESINYLTPTDTGILNGGVKVIPIKTPKGTFKIWTKQIGNSPRMKVLLLNGGPGCTHEYFECLESFFPKERIEFIYYDQLGCGNSDNPKDTSLWDLPRFVDEVEQVRTALHLDSTNFYLLGHSWGGILAMEYALKYKHSLKGLIISNMMSSCPDYDRYSKDVLAKQLDPNVLASIRAMEAKGDFENPHYMDLLTTNFYTKHICRIPLDHWPEPMARSFAKMNQSLYVTMQGPSEFGISGKLVNWDRKADLKTIKIPVLVIGAQYDTMDPDHMKWMSTQFPNGSFLYCHNGSHMAMYDDQQTYMKGLVRFVKGVNEWQQK
jgi:proline iminopeptidase